MQMQLVVLGCLAVLSVGVQAEESCEYVAKELRGGLHLETGNARRNLMTLSVRARRCDGDGDGALNAAEFSGCLHQLLSSVRKLSDEDLNERSACLEKFRSEADQNENDVVDFSEYLRWASDWARKCTCTCDRQMARSTPSQSICHHCCCCG